MKNFVKITTRQGEAIIRSWVPSDKVIRLTQNSITQQGNNEGTLEYDNGTSLGKEIDIIAFNETIDSLN